MVEDSELVYNVLIIFYLFNIVRNKYWFFNIMMSDSLQWLLDFNQGESPRTNSNTSIEEDATAEDAPGSGSGGCSILGNSNTTNTTYPPARPITTPANSAKSGPIYSRPENAELSNTMVRKLYNFQNN